ncbi:MAG: hypothetical protein Kow0091_21050 [Geminocystis sp.]
MTINKKLKQNIIDSIESQKENVSIPDFLPKDRELLETYKIARVLDRHLLNYFQENIEQKHLFNVKKEIEKIILKFKVEVLDSLLKEKDRFRKEINKKRKSFKNIFEFAGCENLYLSNLYTRFISENMGHKLENIAQISNKTFSPEKELNIKLKGIDLIIYHEQKIKYVQLKTKKDTLTGSQSSRTINELKIHPYSIFAAALDMGNSWTINKNECEKYAIQRLAGKSFWSLIDLEYNFILSKFGETIYTIDQELFS